MSLAGEAAGMLRAVRDDLCEIAPAGARAMQATTAAVAVGAALAVALLAHLDLPWWAAISAFMSVQATRPGSVQRAVLRIAGTVAGAVASLAVLPFVAADPVGISVCLFGFAFIGTLGNLVSRHGYMWLFCGITANLVLLLAIPDPASAVHFAIYRVLEVATGAGVACVAALLLAPDGGLGTPPPSPGWSDLLDARWPEVLHATRTGIAVTAMPWVWVWFDLPSLSQIGITAAAVMAVPALSQHPREDRAAVARRAAQRLLGRFLGGVAGLAVLGLSITAFVPWMTLLLAGVWLGAWVQASTRGVAYVGTQAAVVLIVTMVQGGGPPLDLTAGVGRFVGILGGLTILGAMSLLIWPDEPARVSSPAAGQSG